MSKDENNLNSDQMKVKSIGLRAVYLIVGLAVVVLLTVLAVRHFTGPQRSGAAPEDVITGRSFATNKDWNKLTPAEKVTKNPNNCKITRTLLPKSKYKQEKYKQEDVLQEVILEADGRCLPFNPYGLPNTGFDLSVMYDGLSPENFGLTNNIVKQPQAIINNNLVFSSISVVCSDGSNRNGDITPNKICRLDFIYTNNTRQKIRPYHCHIIKATRLVDTSGKAYQPTLFAINTPADWQDALGNSSHRSTGLDCGAIMAGSLGAALEPGQSRRVRINFKLPTASQVTKAGFRDFSLCQRDGSGNCLNSKTSSGATSVELEDCRNIQIIRSNNTYCHQTVTSPDDLIGISTISLLNRPRFGDIEFRPVGISCVESELGHGCLFNFKLVNLGSQQTFIDWCNLFDSIAFEVSQDGQRKIIPDVDEQYWCTKKDQKLTLGDKSSNENVSATLSVYSGLTDDIKFQKIILKDPTKVADETEYTLNIPIRKIEAVDVYTDKNEVSYTVGAITVTEPFGVACIKLSGLSNHECLIFNDEVAVNLKPGDSQDDICASSSLDFTDRLWVSSNNQKQYSTDLQLISSDGKRYSVEELDSYCEVNYYEDVDGYEGYGVVVHSLVLVVAIDLGDAETIKAIQIRDSLDCRKDLISLEHGCLQKAPIITIDL